MKWEETLPWIVRKRAKNNPEKRAICSGEKSITYTELVCMMDSIKYNLKERGIKQGAHVVISAVMKAEYIAAFLAIKELRCIIIPVNKTATESEVKYIIEDTSAKIFLSDNPRYKKIEQLYSLNKICQKCSVKEDKYNYPVNIPDDEVSEILYTSGTTGKPKGAMLSQGGIYSSIHNTKIGMKMESEDIILIPLPLNHSFGLRVLRAALFNGETIVLQNGFTFAKEMSNNINNWNCNCVAMVYTGFEMIKQQCGNEYRALFEKMKYIEFSAGPVPSDARKALIEDCPNVKLYNTWGSTETGGALFLEFSDDREKITSAGHPINDIELAIADENGDIIQSDVNHQGRLIMKTKAKMLGYFNDEKQTKAAIRGEWLYTNDAAYLDEDGYVYLNGRIDDIISVGGEKIAPAAVERLAKNSKGIIDCACIGVKDPNGVLGEVPVLFITSNSEFDESNTKTYIRQHGGGLMVPFRILKIGGLPKNYMGKLNRKELKKIWDEQKDVEQIEIANETSISDELLRVIMGRRSIRLFMEKEVTKDLIEKIVLAGRCAPSGHNMQTWRFTVLQNKKDISELKKITKQVAELKKSSFYGFQNPQTIIVVSNDRRGFTALQDSSCAIENMLLMAHSLGLGACWLNSWIQISDEPEIRKLLSLYEIPNTHIVHGVVALGYPATQIKTPVKKENVIYYFNSEEM